MARISSTWIGSPPVGTATPSSFLTRQPKAESSRNSSTSCSTPSGVITKNACSTAGFAGPAPSSAPEGTIVFESSESGWPLHRSENDLYQPNGARFTVYAPRSLRPISIRVRTLIAISGAARSFERCAYG